MSLKKVFQIITCSARNICDLDNDPWIEICRTEKKLMSFVNVVSELCCINKFPSSPLILDFFLILPSLNLLQIFTLTYKRDGQLQPKGGPHVSLRTHQRAPCV